MITALFVCFVVFLILFVFVAILLLSFMNEMRKGIKNLNVTADYIDIIQRKRFIRYLDQLGRKYEKFEGTEQFLNMLNSELREEIKRLDRDYGTI